MTPSTSEFKPLNIQEVFVLALERELEDAIKDALSRKVPSRFRGLLTQMISFQNECKAFRESVRTTLKLIMGNLRETDTTLSDCYGFIAWKQLFAPAAESTELATAVALSHHTKVVSEMVWSVLSEEQQPVISTAPANATSRKAFTAPTMMSEREVKSYADQWENVSQPALLRDVTRHPAFHYPPLEEDDEEYDAVEAKYTAEPTGFTTCQSGQGSQAEEALEPREELTAPGSTVPPCEGTQCLPTDSHQSS